MCDFFYSYSYSYVNLGTHFCYISDNDNIYNFWVYCFDSKIIS